VLAVGEQLFQCSWLGEQRKVDGNIFAFGKMHVCRDLRRGPGVNISNQHIIAAAAFILTKIICQTRKKQTNKSDGGGKE
jgi:hypothetical protein